MPRRPEKPAPVIVKRPSDERKRLPPDLEAFARSQDEKLRLPRPRSDKGRVNDPREGYTIAGVSNRDARAVYDTRALSMRALWAEGQADEAALAELGQLFHDAQRLSLWRARRVTGFDAFAEQVVGVPAERAHSLVEEHVARTAEPSSELNERSVAAWLRTEAGLYEGDAAARASVRTTPAGPVLELSLRLAAASAGLAGAGARHAPLAREQGESPHAAESAHVPSDQRARAEPRASTPSALPLAGGAKLLTRKRPDASDLRSRAEPRASTPERSEPVARPRPADARSFGEKRRFGAEPAVTEQRGFVAKKSFGAERGGSSLARGTARFDGGEKKAFGDKRGGSSLARGTARFDGGEKSFGDKRGFGAEKKTFGDKRSSSSSLARGAARFDGGEKKAFGDKRGFGGEKKAFGDKRGFGGEKKAFGDKRGFGGEKKAFGDKRGFGSEKKAFGDKRGFGAKKPFGEKRGFGTKKPFRAEGAESRNKAGGGKGFRAKAAPARGGFVQRREPGARKKAESDGAAGDE